MGEERWNPWRALRERPHITLEWTWLRAGGGLWQPNSDGTATIHLDPRLGRRDRRCVLGHELVHDERGVGYSADCPDQVVRREERTVWVEVARRMVPAGELAEFVTATAPLPIEVWEIADEFDVNRKVARLACARLG